MKIIWLVCEVLLLTIGVMVVWINFLYDFYYFFIKKIFLTFIYFWDRERHSMNGGGSERGRHRIWTGSRRWAVSTEPDTGLEFTDREIMTWAEVSSLTDWATQAPLIFILLHILTLQVVRYCPHSNAFKRWKFLSFTRTALVTFFQKPRDVTRCVRVCLLWGAITCVDSSWPRFTYLTRSHSSNASVSHQQLSVVLQAEGSW